MKLFSAFLLLLLTGCDFVSGWDVKKPAFKLGLTDIQIMRPIPAQEKHRYCSLKDCNAFAISGLTPKGKEISAIVCCGAREECTIHPGE